MRRGDYARTVVFGLSFSGVLTAMMMLVTRALMFVLGLDLILKVLGS